MHTHIYVRGRIYWAAVAHTEFSCEWYRRVQRTLGGSITTWYPQDPSCPSGRPTPIRRAEGSACAHFAGAVKVMSMGGEIVEPRLPVASITSLLYHSAIERILSPWPSCGERSSPSDGAPAPRCARSLPRRSISPAPQGPPITTYLHAHMVCRSRHERGPADGCRWLPTAGALSRGTGTRR